MAYDAIAKLRALQLFISGNNAEEIARVLKTDYPFLSANTVREWIEKEKDPNTGISWEQTRNSIERRAHDMMVSAAAREKTDLAGQLEEARQIAYRQITGENPPIFKTLEGAIIALTNISKTEAQIKAMMEAHLDPDVLIGILYESVLAVKDAGPLFKKFWPQINTIFYKKIADHIAMKDITPEIQAKGN